VTGEETLKATMARQCGETVAEAVLEQVKISAKKTGWLIWGGEVHQVTDVLDRDSFGGEEAYWALNTSAEADE
jgi:hypothetical protein